MGSFFPIQLLKCEKMRLLVCVFLEVKVWIFPFLFDLLGEEKKPC